MLKRSLLSFILFSILITFFVSNVYAAEGSGGVQFNSGEHVFIGNMIKVYFPTSENTYDNIYGAQADFRSWLNLNLDNSLTFGKIVAMPDLFAYPNAAISDGTTFADRRATFEKCVNVFLKSKASTLNQVFFYMDYETATIEHYIKQGLPPSEAYKKLGSDYFLNYFFAVPAVAKLQLIGWDHFGKYASLAYEAGHAEAIQTAIDAHNTTDLHTQQQLLVSAYAKEAYADHFLSDRFASGHMRTPDKELAQIIPKDLGSQAVAAIIAILMHDEDNKIGLQVSNLRGNKWIAHGDKRYLNKEDDENVKITQETMQASSDEIKEAFLTGKTIAPENYAALQLVSNLDELNDYVDYVNSNKGTIPIFAYNPETNDVLQRPDLNKLHPDPEQRPFSKSYMLSHGTKWNEWVTLLELEFNYHPQLFAGKSTNLHKYVTPDGKLNDVGLQLLLSSLGTFEKAIFCADNTIDNKMKSYLGCQ